MGSFWGMSDPGKEAGGFSREYGAWNNEQFKQWLQRQNQYGNLGDYYTNAGADRFMENLNGGFPGLDQVRSTGQQISPWATDFNNNEMIRRIQMGEREAGRRPLSEVTGEMSGRLDEKAGNIGRNYDDIQGDINATAGRQFGRLENSNTDIVNNIRDTSDSMRSATNDTFGGLRKDNAATYAGIRGQGESAFADQLKDLSLIMPGGQAQAARVGRSFAPQVSDTLTRLRRAGIDPNSPEAQSMLRNVEGQRSRAMDDASADATLSYVDRKNDVSNKKLGFMTAADRARLENEMGLATGQVDRTNQISDNAGRAYRSQIQDFTGAMNGVDRDRSGRTVENTDTAFQRGQGVLDERNNLTTWGRGAEMQDVDRANQLAEGDSASEIRRGGAMDNQFDRGLAFKGLEQQTRDNAAGQLTNIGSGYRNAGFQAGNMARGFGSDAEKAYDTVYQREAPKAGWGMRLIGGIASAALPFLIPGAGAGAAAARSIGGASIGGMTGAQGGQQAGGGYGGGGFGGYGGGGYGGYGTPPFIPQQQQPWRLPQYQYTPYAPPAPYSGGQMRPDGSFQVQR